MKKIKKGDKFKMIFRGPFLIFPRAGETPKALRLLWSLGEYKYSS